MAESNDTLVLDNPRIDWSSDFESLITILLLSTFTPALLDRSSLRDCQIVTTERKLVEGVPNKPYRAVRKVFPELALLNTGGYPAMDLPQGTLVLAVGVGLLIFLAGVLAILFFTRGDHGQKKGRLICSQCQRSRHTHCFGPCECEFPPCERLRRMKGNNILDESSPGVDDESSGASRYLDFLECGLPASRRSDRRLVMLGTFVDDSGSHSESPIMVLAALVSSTEKWKAFSDAWDRAINEPPRIDYYKSSEYATSNGCFKGIGRDDADQKTRMLTDIVLEHISYGRVSCVLWEDYRDLVVPRIPMKRKNKMKFPVFSHPYFLCFHDIINLVLHEQVARGENGLMDFFFDEQGKLLPRCKRQYQELKEMMEEPFRSLMGDITEGNDKRLLPLQAADLLAWQFRNMVSNPPELRTQTSKKIEAAKKVKSHWIQPARVTELMDIWLDWYVGRPVTLVVDNLEKKDAETR